MTNTLKELAERATPGPRECSPQHIEEVMFDVAVDLAHARGQRDMQERAAKCVGILSIGPDGTDNDERFYAVQKFLEAAIRALPIEEEGKLGRP